MHRSLYTNLEHRSWASEFHVTQSPGTAQRSNGKGTLDNIDLQNLLVSVQTLIFHFQEMINNTVQQAHTRRKGDKK